MPDEQDDRFQWLREDMQHVRDELHSLRDEVRAEFAGLRAETARRLDNHSDRMRALEDNANIQRGVWQPIIYVGSLIAGALAGWLASWLPRLK